MTQRDPTNPVTDHALLRYLQRVCGFDVEKIRNEIATDTVRAICQSGATSIILDGVIFKIRSNGTIGTVVTNKPSGPKRRRRKKKLRKTRSEKGY